jgi:UDP-N-acetylglucosamine 2-epimerase (non-hydrolysing)
MTTIAIITGTRPEIIKLYPIMRLFDMKSIDYKFIHTGQHHDYELSLKFIEEFKIRKPDYSITLTTMPSRPAQQISEIMGKIDKVFQTLNPSLVIVQGDTNSVVTCALAAVKCNILVAHLEAGLRSNDWRMAEEHNRRIVDHISDILFAPTKEAAENLRKEHVHGNIYIVGNTVIDAAKLCLLQQSDNYSNKDGISNNNNKNNNNIQRSVKAKIGTDFVLVTMHRQENVDNPVFLKEVLTALSHSQLNMIFPIHPRTVKRIHEFGLQNYIAGNIKVIEPVGYFDFLQLLRMCRFVITDSGGVQEEVTSQYINKHALVLRDSTERPESVQSGHAILCRVQYYEILQAIKKIETANPPSKNMCPYGFGNATEKIIEILERENIIPLNKKTILT